MSGSDLERYNRQMRFRPLGRAGQERLAAARVLVAGCGALGTVLANTLVRAGVGHTRIVDRDFVELNNLQRQVLFTEADVAAGLPKAVAAANALRAANSTVTIEPVVTDLTSDNIEALLDGIDLVVDGLDNFATRYLINDACVKHGRPWVYAGVVASYGMVMAVRPGDGPCYRCVFRDPPPPGQVQTCDTAGVLGPAVNVVASLAAMEAIKLLVGAPTVSEDLVALDVWQNTCERLPLPPRDPRCPACGERRFEFLEAWTPHQTTALCGRNAIQVSVSPPAALELAALARRWQGLGEVTVNAYLARLRVDGHELTVFPDGRAIIKGTEDAAVARTLYARYVGM
jgi:molybdopterin/thiamine biosynthesis adenylyltransferase